MSKTTTDLAELQAKAAAAQQEAQQRQAELAAEQEAAERARGERVDAATRAALDQYHGGGGDEALRADEARARDAWRQAVLADPVNAAYVQYRACRHRRMAWASDMENAKARTGDERRPPVVNYRDPRYHDDLVAILDDEARALALDEQQQRWTDWGWQ